MNYLSILNEDEVKYICSVIPLEETKWYFNRYPKDFAKVMPGFRATSLKKEQVSALLYRSRNQPFINSFIESHIKRWLGQIQNEINKITDNGESKEMAWMKTLPFCFFVDCIEIFFKLIGEELSKEYISFIDASIKNIRNTDILHEELKINLNKKETEILSFEKEVKRIQSVLDKSSKDLALRSGEIKELKQANIELEKLKDIIVIREKEIDSLNNKILKRDEFSKKIETELSAAKKEQQELELKIREELEKQQKMMSLERTTSAKPKQPKDIEEFKDYLGYNIESIGITTNAEYYPLLKDHLCGILFQGHPILINRKSGAVLTKCIANALVGAADIGTLTFEPDISEKSIHEFIVANGRILCLDNFIGNFNETILLTVCDRYKDKIIFLTTTYDRTLYYVPEEFLKYCHYMNLNRIEAFNHECDLSEDPSFVDEIESASPVIISDARWSSLLKETLDEIGLRDALSVHKSSLVSDEASLCRLLAFDILPYCADVLEISPFRISERLNKYAGEKGRCSYKDLFRRWFVR